MILTEHTASIAFSMEERLSPKQHNSLLNQIDELNSKYHIVGEIKHCLDYLNYGDFEYGNVTAVFVDKQQAMHFHTTCEVILKRFELQVFPTL